VLAVDPGLAQIKHRYATHYYWENGENNYVDFLVSNGYLASDETEEKFVEDGVLSIKDVMKKLDLVVTKMDQLIEVGRNVFAAIVFLIAVMLYVAVAK
jgi:hypothetical protein